MNVKHFEDQMRALRERQAQELLNISYEDGTGLQHLVVSAHTTPPRLNTQLTEDNILNSRRVRPFRDGEHLTNAVKRKSVTSTVNLWPMIWTRTARTQSVKWRRKAEWLAWCQV